MVLVFGTQTQYPLQRARLDQRVDRRSAAPRASPRWGWRWCSAPPRSIAALFVFLRRTRWGIRMRAAGQNPLLAAQRGIGLHGIYALAWGLATFTGGMAGMLIACDAGARGDAGHHRPEGVSRRAGRRAGQPARRARRLAHRRRRRGAAHPLRRTRCSRTWCRSSCCSRCWSCGPGGCSARAKNWTAYERSRAPAATSGRATRATSRCSTRARRRRWLAAFCARAARAVRFSPARSLLDLANQVLLASIGAVALMLLTGFAGPDLARPRRAARRRRVHHRHPVQGSRRAVLGDAARRRRWSAR